MSTVENQNDPLPKIATDIPSTVFVVDYGGMAMSEFQGSIFVLALYDVCDEISLSELRALIWCFLAAPNKLSAGEMT